jgi:hypothetical protein
MTDGFGHVKISRKAYAKDAFWTESREFSKWEAWEWMIQAAAWKAYTRVVGMTEIKLERGEFLASIRYLADAWQWSIKRVRNFLEMVTNTDRIRAQRETQAGTVYLLVNYHIYQSGLVDEGTENGTAGAQHGHTEGTAGAQRKDNKASKADKAGKDGERVARARSNAAPLHDTWRPNQSHAELADSLHIDVLLEADKFRDHAKAKGRVLKDWDAGFRNWLRRAPELNGNGHRSNGKGDMRTAARKLMQNRLDMENIDLGASLGVFDA